MSRKLLLFWLLTGVALFVFLQVCYPYLFFFNEQSQLFLAEAAFFWENLPKPGGLTLWLSEFLVQFFSYPYAGACITAILLTFIAFVQGEILRKLSGSSILAMTGWLVAMAQVWVIADFNYLYQGVLSIVFVLISAWTCLSIRSDRVRLLFEAAGGLILVWWVGAASVLFAVWAFLYEFVIRSNKQKWLSLCPLLITTGLLFVLWRTAVISDFRFAFLPDTYYHHLLEPKSVIYFSWWGVCLLTGYALIVHRSNWSLKTTKSKRLVAVALFVCLLAVFYVGTLRFGELKMRRYMMLDHYSRTGQWQKIEADCQGKITNFLYMNILARALAEQGKLADAMFDYQFRGPQALAVNWNRTEDVSVLLSDIYFTAGNIALSQRLAFEGNSCARGNYNARLLQRLVQTNLIYGEYAVAEKYIRLLEKSWTYREWAKQQRKFLYNDAEVENDPLLGSKRSLLLSPEDTTQQKVAGEQLETAMQLPILANSAQARTAFEYLMGAYLLKKDMASFQYLIDRYWGTPLLPDLPVSYQEALIVAHEKNPEGLDKYALNKDVLSRYADFRKQVLANRNNRGLAGLLYRSFGDTYWYYVVFK